MTVDTGTLIVHWLAVSGAMLLAVGSGIQAKSNLAEYREELNQLKVREELERVLKLLPLPGVGGFLIGISSTLAVLRIASRYNALRPSTPEKARRLRELFLAVAGWLYIMYGALIVVAAGAVQLAVDYGI
jgi:hypothetical protein